MATRIEVLPIGDIVSRVREHVPEPITITVTASPSRGLEATLETAAQIAALGHNAVPHLAARLIRDEGHAARLLGRLQEAGIGEVFVVGGDAEAPAGKFTSGLELLTAMDRIGHALRVGIPSYPEGHPLISEAALAEALSAKAPLADYLVTQMCFDAEAIVTWVTRARESGVDLPAVVGIPGPINPLKLLGISAKVGVGESLRVLKAHRGGARLAAPKPWDPTDLAREIGAAPPALNIRGWHVYSFNDVVAAYGWRTQGDTT